MSAGCSGGNVSLRCLSRGLYRGSFSCSSRLPNTQHGRGTLSYTFPFLKCARVLCRIHGRSFQFHIPSPTGSLSCGNIHLYFVDEYFSNLKLSPYTPTQSEKKCWACVWHRPVRESSGLGCHLLICCGIFVFFRNHAKENCQEAGWGRVMVFFRNPGSKNT